MARLFDAPPRASHTFDEDALEAARQRARATAKPVLLRWLERSIIADPWAFVRVAAQTGEPLFVAHDGERGVTIAAVGAVEQVTCDGSRRFSAAAELCAWGLERSFDVAPDGRPPVWPLLVGGFSFAAGPLTGPWQGWPGSWMFAPRAVWIGDASGAWAGVSVLADQTITYERLVQAGARTTVAAAPRTEVTADGLPQEDVRAFSKRTQTTLQKLGPDLEKAVLARSLRVDVPKGARLDIEGTWKAARERDPRAMVFVVGHVGGEAFVGATPERLVEVDGKRVSTVALAGTAPRHGNATTDREAAESLTRSAKDRREHDSVVASLRQTLAVHCAEVIVSPTRIISTPDVHHLETRIDGMQLRPGGLFAWAERLHPTPAVAGHPRSAALAHLRDNEQLERGYYSGAVGYATAAGDGTLWVAIRSGLLREREAFLYAGAGIVSGSLPEAEWKETEHKLAAMRSALRTAPSEQR
jgi:isochorismate synthase